MKGSNMFKTNRTMVLSIALGLTGVVWVEASTCHEKWVQDRYKCEKEYYETVREASEKQRLKDLDIDEEEFDLNEQCDSQLGSDKKICDRTRLMEESVANDKFIASIDKAGAAFTIAAGYCFGVAAVPVPGAAQGAGGTCLLTAYSVYATAMAVLWIDHSFEMRTAEKKFNHCSFIAYEKQRLCKEKVIKDIARKRKFEEDTLDAIVAKAFNEEQDCYYAADERYERCGSSRP